MKGKEYQFCDNFFVTFAFFSYLHVYISTNKVLENMYIKRKILSPHFYSIYFKEKLFRP